MRSTQFDDHFPFEEEPGHNGQNEPHTRWEENVPGDCIVLCIDDRPLMLERRKAALASHGFCIKTASNGYDAMKMLEQSSVDAVFLEYKQEGMDSEAVAYQIKQRFPNLPIIMLSAYTDIPERVLWLVDEYVMKSELPEGLRRAVQRVKHPTNTYGAHTRRAS
jgi:DNA-binding NtrC family response regulator